MTLFSNLGGDLLTLFFFPHLGRGGGDTCAGRSFGRTVVRFLGGKNCKVILINARFSQGNESHPRTQ